MTDEEIKAKAREIYAKNGKFVSKTARTLREDYNLSAAEIARGLRDGVGLFAATIAWALYSRGGLDLNAAELAHVLYSPDGLDLDAKETARELFDLKALHSPEDCGLSAAEIAKALYSPEGCGLSAAEVAKALRDGCGISNGETAWALFEDGILSVTELAHVLYYGLDLDAKETSRVLFDLGRDATEVVEALHSPEGCGISASDTAKAINWFESSFASIAKALRDGLGLSNMEIALAVKEGCGYDWDHLKNGFIIDGFGGSQTYINDSSVVEALRDGLGLSVAEIVEVMYAEEGLGLRDCDMEIAEALRYGLNLSEDEIQKILKDHRMNEGISEIYKADPETIVEHRGDMCIIRGVDGAGFISAGSFKGKRLRIEDCTVHFQKIEADEIMLDGTLEAGSVTADFVSCDVESAFRAKTLNGDVKLFATAEAMIGTLNGNASFARHPGCVCELKVGTHNGRVRNQGEMEFASMTVDPAIHDEIKARALGVTPIAGQNQLTEIRNAYGGKYTIGRDDFGLKVESSEMTPVTLEFGQIGTNVKFGGMVNVTATNIMGSVATFDSEIVNHPMTLAAQRINGSVFFAGNELHAVEISEDLHLYEGTADVTSIEESAYVFHHSKAEIGQIGRNLEVTGNAEVAVGCVSGSARVIDNGQLKAEKISRRCSVSDDATVKIDWAGSVDAAGNSTVEVGHCPSLALSKDNANLKATYAERCSQLGQSVLSADNWIDFYMGKRTSPGVDGVIREKKGAGKGGIK